MKKVLIMIAYWIAAMLVTAQILVSLDYDLWQATMMSLAFLPSALALSFFLPKVDRTLGRRERIQDTVFIVLGVMSMAFLFLFLLQVILFSNHSHERFWDFPAMLRNPFFIAAILALLAYGHYLLVTWLEKRYPSTRPITFNSEHRKISLKKEDILYVESRDSEVWIMARDGQAYRNRNGITQWENLLGDGFLRIHRAFLVNVAESVLSSPDTVEITGKVLPVSRKYKDSVRVVLSTPHDGDGPEPR
jgi:Response regulator of the LytR/AlgR family